VMGMGQEKELAQMKEAGEMKRTGIEQAGETSRLGTKESGMESRNLMDFLQAITLLGKGQEGTKELEAMKQQSKAEEDLQEKWNTLMRGDPKAIEAQYDPTREEGLLLGRNWGPYWNPDWLGLPPTLKGEVLMKILRDIETAKTGKSSGGTATPAPASSGEVSISEAIKQLKK